jgi:hypothetical protein
VYEQAPVRARRSWVSAQVGVDVTYMVWSLAFLASARKYGDAAVKWVSKSVTDSVELEPRDALNMNSLLWIRKQPSHQVLAWLPTFEHLEWKDLRRPELTATTTTMSSSAPPDTHLFSSKALYSFCMNQNRATGTTQRRLFDACGAAPDQSTPC